MEEVANRLKAIEDKLSRMHHIILELGTNTALNFGRLEKLIDEKLEKLKTEIKEGK
ncbi:MAG: hypothetical protein M0Q26_01040 [Chitinophagaceae bacterium]|nr:hypothetical protein [Chitinophagaceae bacterium]